MVFSNAIFLFVFLPIVILGYYLLRGRARNYWLLAVSLLFYAWTKPSFIVILLASICINYLGALAIDRSKRPLWRRIFVIGTVAINLLLLYYFKYFNFTMEILSKLLSREISFTEVILPIGISFFTFQGLSYVVDVYREDVNVQKNIFKLGMYISLFPQLVAGPIVRYKDVAAEIDDRSVTMEDFVAGIQRFILGLFKKIIIADTLAVTVNAIFANIPKLNTPPIAWLGVVAYALQLFFDFAGYSDMAIGLGRLFGFHFIENFNYPYISRSITEFWRRWHISLSSFFRDYVYIPLGGNRKHVYLNVAIVFLLTGVWHGAAFTYIVWGIWHGFFNLAERFCRTHLKPKKEPSRFWKGIGAAAQHVYTLLVVLFGWVFFRAADVKTAIKYIFSMFGLYNVDNPLLKVGFYLDNWTICVLVLGLIMSTPLLKKGYDYLQTKVNVHVFNIVQNLILIFMLLLCVLQIASNSYSDFIYFQF